MKNFVVVIFVFILSGYANITLANCYSDTMNIAKDSSLYYALTDGERDCACVNNASFGRGWNPGEVIEANFTGRKSIQAVGLYLGCSVEHGEVGSGYIEAKINGSYRNIVQFEDFGYVTNRFIVEFPEVIETDSLRIHMTDGGGGDSTLCVSEIEIYTKCFSQSDLDAAYQNGYNVGYAAGAGSVSCNTGSTTGGALPTITANLDISIPELTYSTLLGSMNLWLNFKYFGYDQNTGKHLWSLDSFGEN